MNKFLIVVITGLLILALFGCSDLSNPVNDGHSGVQRPATKATGTAAPSSLLDPITSVVLQVLPPPASGRQTVVSTTGKITAANGGTLQLTYSYKTLLGLIACTRKATFTVPAGAVKKDVTVSMTFDTTYVGVRFSPEGLVFSKPAYLDMSSTGLDLSRILALGSPNLYYDDEKGNYEEQKAQSITISLLTGSLTCKKGEIPHFSRYAFGR
jgi:hypothetical protein